MQYNYKASFGNYGKEIEDALAEIKNQNIVKRIFEKDFTVWKDNPPNDLFDRSLAEYDAFYNRMRKLLEETSRHYGRFVVFDLHSYNYRRQGPDGAHRTDNPSRSLRSNLPGRRGWCCENI